MILPRARVRVDTSTLLIWGWLLGVTLVLVGMIGDAAFRHAGVIVLAFDIAGLMEARDGRK